LREAAIAGFGDDEVLSIVAGISKEPIN